MSNDLVMNALSQMLIVAISVCGPFMLVILIVGVFVSILQVATQIQEMSLQFVPKLGACIAILYFFGHWMIQKITLFSTTILLNISSNLF